MNIHEGNGKDIWVSTQDFVFYRIFANTSNKRLACLVFYHFSSTRLIHSKNMSTHVRVSISATRGALM